MKPLESDEVAPVEGPALNTLGAASLYESSTEALPDTEAGRPAGSTVAATQRKKTPLIV